MLESIGLTSLDEQVYRTLLRFPELDAAQVAERLGASAAAVQLALTHLVDLSLLCPSQDDRVSHRIVSPDVGLASLLTLAERRVHDRLQRVEAARATIAMLAAEHRDAHQREVVVRHDGIDAVRSRIEVLAREARHEVLSMNPRESQTSDAKEASRKLNEQALRRGVQIRSIYQESIRHVPMLSDYATWLTQQGGEVRTAPVIPMLAIIYDSSTVLVPVDPDSARDGALEFDIPSVTRTLRSLFELTWASATPYSSQPPVNEDGLTPMEKALLQLHLDGHTDAVVARRLGVSLRTVRRIMADLMHRLGARSRFQAGVHAVEAGWLTSGSAIRTAALNSRTAEP